MLTLKALEKDVVFFHFLQNPRSPMLDYFFCAQNIREIFLELSMKNRRGIFHYWDDFSDKLRNSFICPRCT